VCLFYYKFSKEFYMKTYMKKIRENAFSLYFMQFCFFLFGTLILSMISWMNNNIYSSSVMTAFVFVFFYSAGWEMGNKDSRDIDGYTKNYGLAFLTSIIGNLPTIIMTALRVSAPFMYGIGTPKYGLVNGFYRLWLFYYNYFTLEGDLLLCLLPLLFVPVMFMIGYFFGLRRMEPYNLNEKLRYKQK